MLQVAYDITSLAESPRGGIARVCYNTLLHALDHSDIRPTGYYRTGSSSNVQIDNAEIKRCGPLTGLFGSVYDIAHSLCHRTLKVRAKKSIYTVQDVWSLNPNKYQSPGFQKKVGRRMRQDILNADHVVAISETTRKNLMALDMIPPEKCSVVHLGYSPDSEASETLNNREVSALINRKYVLFVGCLEIRKNLGHVIDAVRPLAGVDLAIAGQPGYGFNERIKSMLESFPAERLHLLTDIGRGDLIALYRHAVATLLPSWQEGFGLPILEAMANGSPIITSNRSANAEIGGGGAILVDPEVAVESQQQIEKLMQDSEYRAQIVEAGWKQAALFTWDKYTERLVEIYRETLQLR